MLVLDQDQGLKPSQRKRDMECPRGSKPGKAWGAPPSLQVYKVNFYLVSRLGSLSDLLEKLSATTKIIVNLHNSDISV